MKQKYKSLSIIILMSSLIIPLSHTPGTTVCGTTQDPGENNWPINHYCTMQLPCTEFIGKKITSYNHLTDFLDSLYPNQAIDIITNWAFISPYGYKELVFLYPPDIIEYQNKTYNIHIGEICADPAGCDTPCGLFKEREIMFLSFQETSLYSQSGYNREYANISCGSIPGPALNVFKEFFNIEEENETDMFLNSILIIISLCLTIGIVGFYLSNKKK